MPMINLVSSDGKTFQLDKEIARKSITIKTMMEDLGLDEEDEGGMVPLQNINADILKKVIHWATHHKDDPTPVPVEAEEDNIFKGNILGPYTARKMKPKMYIAIIS